MRQATAGNAASLIRSALMATASLGIAGCDGPLTAWPASRLLQGSPTIAAGGGRGQ